MGLERQRAADLALADARALQELGFPAGTLPSPDALRRYDEMIPGSAERIFLLAEDQARQRYELERAMIKAEATRTYVALGTAAGIAALCIVLGFIIVIADNGVGASIATLGIALFAGVFLYTSKGRRQSPQSRPAPAPIAHELPAYDL
jgi:uncharacterized membrane protein